MDTIAPVRADRQHPHALKSVTERVVNRTLYTLITSESAHSNARVVIRVDRVPVIKSHPTEFLCERIRCSAPVALLTHFVLLQDVVDLSWSASHFLLSASVDCTVRLWHISETQCLRVFR